MIDSEKILNELDAWLQKEVYSNHIKNIKKLKNPKSFKINPFLLPYIARVSFGSTSPYSLAKTLVLPRVMGTSVTTSFGSKMQDFIVDNIEHAKGSGIPGIDIEFLDQTLVERPKIYCQVKAGPNTINSDDVTTIEGKFRKLRRKANQDKLKIGANSMIVGILYGSEEELSGSYKKIRDYHNYGVHIGKEFWEKLTGDETFYHKMEQRLQNQSKAINETTLIKSIITELSETKELVSLSKSCDI